MSVANPETREAGHTLFFDGIRVAKVHQEDCELVAIMGAYELVPTVRHDPALRPVARWHDHCVAWAAREALGRETEAADRAREVALRASLVAAEWRLRDGVGDERRISLPRFLTHNKMVWQWTC